MIKTIKNYNEKLYMYLIRKLFFYILVFFVTISLVNSSDFSLNVNSPTYFGEQDNVFEDIHFLENELLSVSFCNENEISNISITLTCPNRLQNVELEYFEDYSQEGCFYSNYQLENRGCDEFSLDISYIEENKLKSERRFFKEQRESLLINHIFSENVETLDPLELSYYLIVLNEVRTTQSRESQETYDMLRDLRNNDNKCWPSNNCNLLTTAKILKNIKLAGYEEEVRLLEDGRNYLELNTLSKGDISLDVEIILDHNFSNDVRCNLTIDGDNLSSPPEFESEEPQSEDFSEFIEITCEEEVDMIEFNIFAESNVLFENVTSENTDTLRYELKDFSCIGDNSCDVEATLLALATFDNIRNKASLENFVESYFEEDSAGKNILDVSNQIINTGRYLKYKKEEGLIDFLKFRQNNDGSWGGGSSNSGRIESTAWAYLGLLSADESSEYTSDAIRWTYFNEPEIGWRSVERNSLAFMTIRDFIKPYLKVSQINTIEDIESISLQNPTPYNLRDIEISFIGEVNRYLSYKQNLGDLDADEQVNVDVEVLSSLNQELTGYMLIEGLDERNQRLELLRVPISVKGNSPFILNDTNSSISSGAPQVSISVETSEGDFSFTCQFENPFTGENETVTVTDTTQSVELENPELLNGEFEVEFTCDSDLTQVKQTVLVSVEISEPTFEVLIDNVTISNFNDFSIPILNLNSDIQTISAEVEGISENVINPIEDSRIFSADEERNLYFTIVNEMLLESFNGGLFGNVLLVSEDGYSVSVPIYVELDSQSESRSIWFWILMVLGGFAILILLRVMHLKYKEYKYLQDNPGYSGGNDLDDEINFDDY